MLNRKKIESFLSTRRILTMLIGAAIVPAICSGTVGILTLALLKGPKDIVMGVLVLTFASTSLIGVVWTVVYIRRSERLRRMERDFIDNITHELRTPLTSIRMFVDSLQSGRIKDPADIDHSLSILQSEITRFSELIERILDWQPLAFGVEHRQRHPEAIWHIVEEAIRPFTFLDRAAAPPLKVDLAPSLPMVRVELKAVVTALRNLVHNALRHGDGSLVTIKAHLSEGGVVILVSDEGPGIDPKEHSRIFEKYYRIHQAGNPGGYGLGLTIARSIIEEQGGRLDLESEEGRGATFSIYLPTSSTEEHEKR